MRCTYYRKDMQYPSFSVEEVIALSMDWAAPEGKVSSSAKPLIPGRLLRMGDKHGRELVLNCVKVFAILATRPGIAE